MFVRLLLPANLAFFSTFYLCWYLKQEKLRELKTKLDSLDETGVLYSALSTSGVWSVERMLTTNIPDYPNELTANEALRKQVTNVKNKIKEKYYLRLWLKERNLEKFLLLEEVSTLPSLPDMVYWYPGLINDAINSHIEDEADRFFMKENVFKFKSALTDIRIETTLVLSWFQTYDDEFKDKARHFCLDNLQNYISSKGKDELFFLFGSMILFTLINHYLVQLGTPPSNPGTSNICLSLLLFYIHPELGQLNLYIILLYRVFVDPIKTVLLYCIAMETWMLAANSLRDSPSNLITMSVFPTLIFVVCHKALKFQPLVERLSKSNDLIFVVTGLGFIDPMLEKFITTKSASFISRILLGCQTEKNFEWEDFQSIKLYDCDISWKVLIKLIKPSLRCNNLRNLTIINNRCMTDKDASKLADLLKGNDSLKTLQLAFRLNDQLMDKVYKCCFWDNCSQQLTQKGLCSILKAINDKKKVSLQVIDMQGTKVNDDFIALAKHLHLNKEIKILASRESFLNHKKCAGLCSSMLLKILCVLFIILFVASQIYMMFEDLYSVVQQYIPDDLFI